MKIDLSHIEKEPVRFDEELVLEPDNLDSTRVAEAISVRLRGIARSVGAGFLVDGSIRAAGKLVCVRCLEPVPWQAEEEFSLEYRRRDAHPSEEEVALEDGELDVAFLTQEVLDLSQLAAEQVLLALPMRIVCDDECAGLCPQCGANRNVAGSCRCEPEVDPRWEALRDVAGRDAAN